MHSDCKIANPWSLQSLFELSKYRYLPFPYTSPWGPVFFVVVSPLFINQFCSEALNQIPLSKQSSQLEVQSSKESNPSRSCGFPHKKETESRQEKAEILLSHLDCKDK